MTKQTTNLNLNKPDMADQIALTISQLGSNFDIIDASITNNTTALADITTLAPVPNGVDDTTVLRNLFSGGNKKILFSHSGQYIISSTINLFSDTTVEVKGNVEFFLKANSPCYMFVAEGTSFQNIKWTGGIINGNDVNQGVEQGAGFDTVKGMVFKNVKNLSVQGLTVKNTRGHGINHWNCDGVVFRDIQFDQSLSTLVPTGGSRRDGITGMSSNILIDNISGFTDDDLIAILSGVDWAGTNTTPIDIYNIEIRNIKAKKHSSGRDPWKGVAVYTSGGYTTRNIKIDGVYGDFNDSLIYIGNYSKPTRGNIERISISNVFGEATFNSGTNDDGMIKIVDVAIDDISFRTIKSKLTVSTNTKKFLIISNESDIDKLSLLDINHKVTIPLTDYNAIFREYATGSHNIKDVQVSNVNYSFLSSFKTGFLYVKNNTIACTTKLAVNNLFITPTTHGQNGTTLTDTLANIFALNQAKILFSNDKIPTIYVFTTCNIGDVIFDPRYGKLRYDGSKYLCIDQTKIKTSITYDTFDAQTLLVLVDSTNAAGTFRIQDATGSNPNNNFPDGFIITIKRVDNNSVVTAPYVKMTNNQVMDGTDTYSLSAYQTLRFTYQGGTWRKL